MGTFDESKKTKIVGFELKPEGTVFTLENQDGLLEDVTENDILEYIDILIDDEEQFVTLCAPKAIKSIRYVQAAVTDGKIEVQIGVEREKCYLYYKECTESECKKLFTDFFHSEFNPNMDEYRPVEFF